MNITNDQIKEVLMPLLVFENTGEIDLKTVSTFGCSVKETSNPIGYFGTGLKYAIAVLLRTGHQIVLQSGLEQLEVSARKDTIRGKEFDFVFIGETPAGFTTELGKNWEVWMAYRELYCNAKDEPNWKVFEADSPISANAGFTRVLVSGQKLLECHHRKHEFILEGTPIFKLDSIEVHRQPSRGFFYKGIKVMDFREPALYTYNCTGSLELTEDRTVKDPHAVAYKISRDILAGAPAELLEKILVAGKENIEYVFDYHGWSGTEPGSDFFPTVAKLQRSNVSKVNFSALKLWREKGGGIIDPRRIRATKVQLESLEKAISFCEKAGFMLRDEYPIMIVESLGDAGTLAIADPHGKQIFLTEMLFMQDGTKGVARALIEEYLHLKFKFTDCSREMQNFLFAKLVSLAEELNGESL